MFGHPEPAFGIDGDAVRLVDATGIILANRGSGPDAVMQLVEDRCGGVFDNIEDVIPKQELADHAAGYKATAGFAIDALNARSPLIPEGARYST